MQSPNSPIHGGSVSMLDFEVDCLIGEIVSIDQIKKNQHEIIFHIDRSYGNHSVFGKSESNFVCANFKNSELKFFHKIVNNVYQYYISEFDPMPETVLYNLDKNNLLSSFKELKLISDGIVFEIEGAKGKSIFQDYGSVKFAGFVFMNYALVNSMENTEFNQINMNSFIKEKLVTQNIFNFLIPVGNLKKSLTLLRDAANIFN